MNDTMQTLLSRRSIRAFENKEIPSDELDMILKAALHAPSGMGRQTWQFTAICSRDKIQRLAKVMEKELNRPGYNIYEPEVLIIPSNDRDNIFGKEDNACALENIFLAARSFGIGSVWINQLQDISDIPAVRELLREWGVPDNHVVYGMAALGYPVSSPADKERTGKVVIVK